MHAAPSYGLMIRNHKSYRASGVPPAISSEFRPHIVPKSQIWRVFQPMDTDVAICILVRSFCSGTFCWSCTTELIEIFYPGEAGCLQPPPMRRDDQAGGWADSAGTADLSACLYSVIGPRMCRNRGGRERRPRGAPGMAIYLLAARRGSDRRRVP